MMPICSEGYEARKNTARCILGTCSGAEYLCYPITTSTTTTTTTTTQNAVVNDAIGNGVSVFNEYKGKTLCSDGVMRTPSECKALGGSYTTGLVLTRSSSPSTISPSGQEAVVTNKSNMQYYILYGVLGIAIVTLLIKRK
jgi:hypothetical protein